MHIKNFVPRTYQKNILETCKNKNTLVCIPTGMGKTKIAILLAIEQLNKHKNTKVLMLTPTKPLANQIYIEFKECTSLSSSEIILLTGAINPKKRKENYESAKIIIATPQTVQKDIENNRIVLGDFSALIIDEAHRSRENFANTSVAKEYMKKAKFQNILALTASPGSTKEKIDEICINLGIEAVEIRTENDEDVKEFVQDKNIEYINLELGEEIRTIHQIIKQIYLKKIEGIRNFNINKPSSQITKIDLLLLQKRLQKEVKKKNMSVFYGLFLIAQLLKMGHIMEMLETQGTKSAYEFLNKLETEETKSAKAIIKEPGIIAAKELCKKLIEKSLDHPKMDKLKEIIIKEVNNKKDARIIIFATYRNTVENIVIMLNNEKIKTTKLIGQKEGFSQKKQIEVIKEFDSGIYSCLVTTSIGEEGIHIGEADMAIFYDNAPSGIRKIQRSGRVGRMKSGRIIFMITKNTKDAAYHWKSQKDEKRMKGILYQMKDKPFQNFKKQKSLNEF